MKREKSIEIRNSVDAVCGYFQRRKCFYFTMVNTAYANFRCFVIQDDLSSGTEAAAWKRIDSRRDVRNATDPRTVRDRSRSRKRTCRGVSLEFSDPSIDD